jgi:hypothetical protein
MWPRHFPNAAILVIGLTFWGLFPPSATAQTQDILGPQEIQGHNGGSMREVARLARELQRDIDLRALSKVQTLKEALIALHEAAWGQGIDLPIITDVDSFKGLDRAGFDVYQATVRLPSNRRTMTIQAILQSFVDQATGGKGTWLIRPDFVEITRRSREWQQQAKNPLTETVDLAGAPPFMPFEKVIDCLTEQLQSKARPVDLDIDVLALQKAVSPRFDLAKLKVRLPHADPNLTVGQFLRYIVDQIPGSNAEILAVQNAIQVTTVERADILRPLRPRLRTNYNGPFLEKSSKRGEKAVE